MKTFPKISIVTPSYNQGQYIEHTIDSILSQNYPNLEYIVVDGGSTDNTIDVIKKYEKYLAWWISEPDNGQSDAINKGIQRSTGDVFNWLNSDDTLTSGALKVIAELFAEENALAVCGQTETFGEVQCQVVLLPAHRKGNTFAKTMSYYNFNQPATFYRRKAIERMGPLSTSLHYCMDHEWWFKFLCLFGVESVAVTDEVIANFRIHNESKTTAESKKFFDDYASFLYALIAKKELSQYKDILLSNFEINRKYELVCDGVEGLNEAIVRQKLAVFLLKASYLVFNESDFNFAQEVEKLVSFDSYDDWDDQQKRQLTLLRKATSKNNWNAFRFFRKIEHVFGRR